MSNDEQELMEMLAKSGAALATLTAEVAEDRAGTERIRDLLGSPLVLMEPQQKKQLEALLQRGTETTDLVCRIVEMVSDSHRRVFDHLVAERATRLARSANRAAWWSAIAGISAAVATALQVWQSLRP